MESAAATTAAERSNHRRGLPYDRARNSSPIAAGGIAEPHGQTAAAIHPGRPPHPGRTGRKSGALERAARTVAVTFNQPPGLPKADRRHARQTGSMGASAIARLVRRLADGARPARRTATPRTSPRDGKSSVTVLTSCGAGEGTD